MSSRSWRGITSIVVACLALCALAVVAEDNGLAPLPYMGWNSWSTDDIAGLLDLCFESEVHGIADAMAKYLKPLGYNYVILDDCWAAHERDAQGRLQGDAKRFPSGMKALVDYVHSKGLRIGFYTCAGNITCKYNRPGSYGHYDLDAQTFASWGADLVKLDNCHIPHDVPDRKVLYSQFSRALNATGRHMLFALCEWGEGSPWEWAGDIANSWRIHTDLLPWWWGSQGTLQVIESAVNKSAYGRPGAWNYLDIMQILTFETGYIDSKTMFSIWALVNSPLVTGCDIRDLGYNKPKADILMNTDVIAVNQDPLAKPGDRIAQYADGGQVWAKPIVGGHAVILFNPHDVETRTIKVTWDMLGYKPGTKLSLYDVWTHKSLGDFVDGYDHLVWMHDVMMFTAKPV